VATLNEGLKLVRTESVEAWLEKRLRAALAWNAVGVVGFLLTGLVVLFVSFWVTYGVIWFISSSVYPLSHHVRLLIAALFMILVVVVGIRQNREDVEPLDRQLRVAHEMDIELTPYSRFGISYQTEAVKAAAFEIRSVASVINYILCGGVILILSSWRRVSLFRRMKDIDREQCARVITLLKTAAKRQSFVEIVEKLPGLNPVKVFDDLSYIEGVIFLANEPPGLTLLPEVSDELNQRPSD
jgi:hypothetical protein